MTEDYAIFARVVECGSLSRAARELHMSVAKISKRLSTLEDRLGVRLIQRTTRQLFLTSAGEQFYHEIVDILAAVKSAEDGVTGRASVPSGRLRISSGVLVGRRFISPAIPEFIKRYPGVRLQLDLSDDFVNLEQGYYDLAIRMADVSDQHELVGYEFSKNRRLLFCSQDYVRRRGVPQTIDDLKDHDLIGAASQFPWRLEGPEGLMTIYGRSIVETNATEVVRDLLLGGLGIALRSPWDIPDELRLGSIVHVLPDYRGAAGVGVYAMHRKGPKIPPAVSAFIEHIRPAFAWLNEQPDPPGLAQ